MATHENCNRTMSKTERYKTLFGQIKALVADEDDLVANMANVAAMLHHEFGFWWTGFYRVCTIPETGKEMLVLGPFQGPLACSRIACGKGVCGTAWAKANTVIVPDVDRFPGHIACDSASNSEIVVPIHVNGRIWGVLDIDSPEKNRFSEEDKKGLEQFVRLLEESVDWRKASLDSL